MGLVKSGVKYGAAAYMINQASKAFSSYSNQQQQPQSQPQQQQQYYPQQQPQQQQQRQQQQAYYPNQPSSNNVQLYRDANGVLHQQWCNGQCGGRCCDNIIGSSGNNNNSSNNNNRGFSIPNGQTDVYETGRTKPPAYMG